jgi:cysteinyl-tRNA synthetase
VQSETLLKLHNNLTQKTETFQPAQDRQVKMYTCGPSTYQRAHIGNYRTFLFEDILQRYLEFLNYKVTRLITLTNIEDKAIAQAQKESVSVEELTNRNEAEFFGDFEKLHINRPDYTVRASTIVNQAAKLIKSLIDKGVAYNYPHQGAKNIYYNPTKFAGFGKLAHLDMDKWPNKKRLFHLDTYPGMPWNKGDFILWHGCRKSDNVCWETEIGRGRPAWNIQDAAMVTKHLGFSIDVACGGIDNLVRHHDYTIAVAEAVSGKPFARYWLHGGHLYVDGKKMSKSKGNVLYPQDLTAKGYSNEQVRFFLIYGNYRKRRNFTWENLSLTSRLLDNFKAAVQNLQKAKAQSSSTKAKVLSNSVNSAFCKCMDNDLDVKGAFDELYKLVTALQELVFENKLSSEDAQTALTDLKEVDRVLQVIF